MPLLKKILKNSPNEVIIKWTGSGSDTVGLASLVATGQTLTGDVAPAVNILSLSVSMPANSSFTVTRNGEIAIHGHESYEFQTDGIIQAVISENSTFDIVVDLGQVGTAIIKLKKTQGYSGLK